MHLH
jgi:hypothetical protein